MILAPVLQKKLRFEKKIGQKIEISEISPIFQVFWTFPPEFQGGNEFFKLKTTQNIPAYGSYPSATKKMSCTPILNHLN